MIEIDRTESMRKLLDLSLAAGKAYQSSYTGLIHYTYHALEGENRDCTPLIENFLFALALLRMRTSEAVAEGKALLDRLLHFQSREGQTANFPVYLHDYPACKDRYVAAHLLPIFYWVLKKFSSILGAELRQRMETTAELLLAHCVQNYREKVPSYPVAIKIAAAVEAFDRLKNPDAPKHNTELLDSLRDTTQFQLLCPTSLAETLVALQMVYPRISESSWKPFWSWISTTWHRQTSTYAGPAQKELQAGFEPQATLYDLYLGYLSGKFSARALKGHPYQLQAALIQSSVEPLFKEDQESFAYSILDKKENFEKGDYPFRLVWGDEKRVHTFSCTNGNATAIDLKGSASALEFLYHLPESANLEEREKNRDVAFYMDLHEGVTFLVNGAASNTFKPGDLLTVRNKELLLTLKFSLHEGSAGEFFGHWMLGNRPSQVSVKGENRFHAYDWQLFLRSVRRSGPCVVKVEMKLQREA